jgi:hypothetical protein
MCGRKQEENKQIVRSEPSTVQTAVRIHHDRIPAKYTPYVKGVVGLSLLGFAGWLLQNFLQLRGVVNLLASRIDLGSSVITSKPANDDQVKTGQRTRSGTALFCLA